MEELLVQMDTLALEGEMEENSAALAKTHVRSYKSTLTANVLTRSMWERDASIKNNVSATPDVRLKEDVLVLLVGSLMMANASRKPQIQVILSKMYFK